MNKKIYRKKINIIYEKNLLGGYGTLYKNRKFFGNKDFLVIHSDNYFDGNLKKFITFCNNNLSFDLNLLSFKTNDFKNTGILKINKKNILEKIYEKYPKKKGVWANGAVYFFSKRIWSDLKKKKKIMT